MRMNARFDLDPGDKVLMFNISTDAVVPKYLHYLCEYILNIRGGVNDWQDWFAQLTDIRVPINQLKDMTEWDAANKTKMA